LGSEDDSVVLQDILRQQTKLPGTTVPHNNVAFSLAKKNFKKGKSKRQLHLRVSVS